MEAYFESKVLTVFARYQKVGRGWSKKKPEFQRILAEAQRGMFDTMVCWKSNRLSRGIPHRPQGGGSEHARSGWVRSWTLSI